MLGLRKADQASMGLLFVSLFGVFDADLSRVQSEGSRMLFMVHDALLFIQQKYHYAAETSDLIAWAASLFLAGATCIECMEASSGELPRLSEFPDCFVECHKKVPMDICSWLESLPDINWKNRLKQLDRSFGFIESLCEDDRLDREWRASMGALTTIVQDILFVMTIYVNLKVQRGETLCGISCGPAEREFYDADRDCISRLSDTDD